MKPIPRIAVIGAGPAGLMAAEQIQQAGFIVHVYDAMPSAARKFLMAGVGGMNITHAEPLPYFLQRYKAAPLAAMIQSFPPQQLREWIHQRGITTFIGSSGRVFPLEMKAAPLLRRWLQALRQAGVEFFMRHQWQGWRDSQTLLFTTPEGEVQQTYDAIVLALGGASWPKLGSTGSWQPILAEKGIAIATLQPSNCGFKVTWSQYLLAHAGHAIKNAHFSYRDASGHNHNQLGECMITAYGIEGGAIYALSAVLRDALLQGENPKLIIDFMPNTSEAVLIMQLSGASASLSTTNLLRKKTKLSATAIALLYECHDKHALRDIGYLAKAIKNTRITLHATQAIEEAISSAGGIVFDELDANLMLKKLPGVFCAGEMLDWEAPTGGYLLTGCFATGKWAGDAVVKWLHHTRS